MNKIQSFLITAFSLATLPFMVGCDTAKEKQEKIVQPEVARQLIETSLRNCDRSGPINLTKEAYSEKLNEVFMETRPEHLEFFRDRNITICLDQRLSNTKERYYNKDIYGIFYNDKKTPVVSLWDDGKNKNQHSYVDYYKKARLLNKLTARINDDPVSIHNQFLYAGKYRYDRDEKMEWRRSADFDQNTLRKNPGLRKTPLKKSFLR